MNLDELRSAQSRERQASQLQHLRDSFYEEAAEYIRGLRAERERVAERSEHSFPADDPEVKRLTDEIDTAEEVVEALYERRVGKVVKKASFAAADMNVDAEGLTTEESQLFETLVGNIEANRASVLEALAGEAPTGGGDTAEDPATGQAPSARADRGGASREGRASDAGRNPAPGADAATPGEPRADGEEPTFRIGEAGEATADDLTTGGGAEDSAPPAAPPPSAADAAEADRSPSAGEGTRADPPAGSTAADARPADRTGHETGPDGMDAASAMGGEGGADPAGTETPPGTGDDHHAVPPAEEPPSAGGGPEPGGSDAPSTGSDPTPTAEAGAAETEAGPDAAVDGPGTAPSDEGGAGPGAGGVPTDGTRSPPSTEPDSHEATPGTQPAGGGPSAAGPGDPTAGAGTRAGGRDDAPTGGESDGGPGDTPTGGDDGTVNDPGTPELALVRVTEDVGEIFGVDDREYDLAAGDVVSLPAPNAAPLVDGGVAERLQPDRPADG